MSKRFLKTIALASTLILTLLGGTETTWGMWEGLDENQRSHIANIHSVHEATMYNDQEYEDAFKIKLSAKLRLNPVEIEAWEELNNICDLCLEAREQLIAVKNLQTRQIQLEKTTNEITQEIKLTTQSVNERIQSLETEVRTAQNVILQLQKREQEERERREDKEQFQENIGSLGTNGTSWGMWEELDDDDKVHALYLHLSTHEDGGWKGMMVTGSKELIDLGFLLGTKNEDLLNEMTDCRECLPEMERYLGKKIRALPAKKEQVVSPNNNENATISISLNNLVVPAEGENSLFSTVKSLREIKLQHEKTIKNLHEEAEESTEIIKKMMRIIGIKTDDFSDCTGNIFAKNCLDRLKDEMGSIK